MKDQAFQQFLDEFIPKVAKKEKERNLTLWQLETTGDVKEAEKLSRLEIELTEYFSDSKDYQRLRSFEGELQDPLLKRQLKILLLGFKANQVPKDLREKITNLESEIMVLYSNHRSEVDGKKVSENEIREVLRKEKDPQVRKKYWEASKEIGNVLAPKVLEAVQLRNEAAKSLGYSDYFTMGLDLSEIDAEWLDELFFRLSKKIDKAHEKIIQRIEAVQMEKFHVEKEELGPWAWADPYGQEDPLEDTITDQWLKDKDPVEIVTKFYDSIGYDIRPILDKSDLYEREGKNQHAFCISIDRYRDIRTLDNVKPTNYWLGTLLHELGHAIYDLSFQENLPWLLRQPPHLLTTEAVAMMFGKLNENEGFIKKYLQSEPDPILLEKKAEGLKRAQLILAKWILVMHHFEKQMYKNPSQDLNKLWWDLVERYQKIKPPANRENSQDWASKYHIALAPVYYYSYLLGELFASSLKNTLEKETNLWTKASGMFLKEKLFYPGSSYRWNELVKKVTGDELTEADWIRDYGN